MYSFSLASNRKGAAEAAASAAAAAAQSSDPTLRSAPHVIRSPSELRPATAHTASTGQQQQQQPGAAAGAADAHPHGGSGGEDPEGLAAAAPVSNARFGWHPGHPHVPTASLYATVPKVEPPVRVHNVTGYTDLREAADWSVEVQRERAEKKRRALAQHEAVKLAEQRRRDAQEAQANAEMHQRRLERQQERTDQRDAASMTDFQERNTRFLQNQQRLMEVGAYVTQAESQHRAHAREDLYKSWTSRHHMAAASPNGSTWKGSNVAGLASVVGGSFGISGASGTGVPATTSAPATEEELRLAAQATEAAYVQLSLAYRSEAQRSLAAAAILMGGPAARHRPGRALVSPPPPPGRSASQLLPAPPAATAATSMAMLPTTIATAASQVGGPSPPPQSTAPSPAGQGTSTPPQQQLQPPAAEPFRTAPQMFTHASAEHMGDYANAIPYTYIPEYFDAPSEGAAAVQAAAAAAAALAMERERLPRRRGPGADGVMPLTLSPVPVSAAVTAALQNTYYPWALHTGAAGALAKAAASLSSTPSAALPAPRSLQAAPARGSELPVPQWSAGELRDTRFGHDVAPDGTLTEPCERKRVCAAARGYSTFPRDNATATTNPVEPQLPLHFGKRVDVWL